eukprot:c20775_g2_i1.p1 GENE.c20775_g2_i1~~c20775_g2_i1.p1  ORF type:complete len:648 (-),score=292.20 c20775_g2_i1:128-2071(-)
MGEKKNTKIKKTEIRMSMLLSQRCLSVFRQGHIQKHLKPSLCAISSAKCHSKVNTPVEAEKKSIFKRFREGRWPEFLTKERSVASPDYNRWITVPACFAVQGCVGAVYAWSMWNQPLTEMLGVVVRAADDWPLGQVIPLFSTSAIAFGSCTFLFGRWAEKAGPRMVATTAAIVYSSGYIISGIGCLFHYLPLVYLGYGVFGGIGWGLGYVSPVSTLMKWFPDRRGLATGLGLTAFGGGAMIGAPIIKIFTDLFFSAPKYLGTVENVTLTLKEGRQYADVEGSLQEVVVATIADVSKFSEILTEGVYVVGTGSTGAAGAFASIGALYFVTMMCGAFCVRLPHPDWKPYKDWKPENTTTKMITSNYVDEKAAMRTPQFYIMWSVVFCNGIAGASLLSSAKLVMTDIFGTMLPMIVTGGFASSYVVALSIANSVGRLGWGAASDFLGRRNTYFVYALAIPICLGIPSLTAWAMTTSSALPLVIFCVGTLTSLTFYGGNWSVLPAYIADIFGQKHIGAIHGKMLTALASACIFGPKLLATLRESSYTKAIDDLVAQIDPNTFQKTFGAPVMDLPLLLKTNTVTINRLMEIVPQGVTDPTPFLYNSTMYTVSGVLCIALLCNITMKPLNPNLMKSDANPNTFEEYDDGNKKK